MSFLILAYAFAVVFLGGFLLATLLRLPRD